MIQHKIHYFFIRSLLYPVRFLSYRAIHQLGRFLGVFCFYFLHKFRKRSLSNLALAKDLRLSPQEVREIAKKSMQNLSITALEYIKLFHEKKIEQVAYCENPQEALELLKEGQGIIFFCGHQANWEILFLEGTSRMPGVAIGRPVKNMRLYNWVLTIRQKFGGLIITPKQAFKEGLRALKSGKFLGIVGDQGMPDSGFRSSFLGCPAWTSPIPALLSYRSGRPILVASTKRKDGKYFIKYSPPIWPNKDLPMEEEIKRLMDKTLSYFEETIKESPEQWLWQHNRFKQQSAGKLKREFRHDSLAIFLPQEEKLFFNLGSNLQVFRELYPYEFITVFAPKNPAVSFSLNDIEVIFYHKLQDLYQKDYRFKLIFNFTSDKKLSKHFLSLSAFKAVHLEDFLENSQELTDFQDKLKNKVLNAV